MSLGWAIGQLGHAFDPGWAAYAGLALLGMGMLTVAAVGARIKCVLLPLANEALVAAWARRDRLVPA